MLSCSATSSPTKASVCSAGGVAATRRRPDLVAVDAADAVAVVAVGDQHVVAAEVLADGSDPFGVGDPLDDVLDAVDGHGADRLAGSASSVGQAGGQRQTPDRATGWPRSPASGRGGRSTPWASSARGAARRRRPRRRPRAPPSTPTRSRAAPAASVKRIRYSVNVGRVVDGRARRRRSTGATVRPAAA